nr:ABC transporter substrate-binding protein [Actinomycetota bacterium]
MSASGHPARPMVLVMACACLLSAACGARLTPQQRADALSAVRPGTVTSVQQSGAPVSGVAPGALADPFAAPSAASIPAGAVAGAPAPASNNAPTAAVRAPTAPMTPGTGAAGAVGAVDTRPAPPGGNGGATDKGITETTITIANVSDVSGPVPGLFEDAQLAVKAYVAYFTAREGTVYGRQLRLLALDSRLDTGANRSASIQACNEAFAGVGSMSAFDQGGAPVVGECGFPDLRSMSLSGEMKSVATAFPINPAGSPGERALGQYGWLAQRFPEAVKKAAFLFVDGGAVTRELAEEDVLATEAFLGYDFVYTAALGITETNYSPFVQQMKSKGVRHVTFVGAYQQAAALAKEMQRQGFAPDVYAPTVTAYDDDFLAIAGPAAEGTYIAVGTSLNEETAANEELQLYASWLDQIEPGAVPTSIGQYAWSAAKLFVEKMKEVGPRPTRKALLEAMPAVTAYTGGGLLAPANIGGRQLNDCAQFVQVQGGR